MNEIITIFTSPFSPRSLALADKLAESELLNGNVVIHPCQFSSEFCNEIVKQTKEEKPRIVHGLYQYSSQLIYPQSFT